MRVRYTGVKHPRVTFVALGREVETGGLFDVPDDTAEGYLARGDVEKVEDPKPALKTKALPEATDAVPDAV